MPTIYEKSEGVFLDLANCGSSVRWGVSVEKSRRRPYNPVKNKHTGKWKDHYTRHCTVTLTDCTRTITWSDPRMQKKVKAAIRSLERMLRAMQKAEAKIPKGGKKSDY